MADDQVEKASMPSIQQPPPKVPSYTQGGGSFGMQPQFAAGMTFKELGSSGLRAFSGWVREEFMPELVGRQGAQKYREMLSNSPIIGAIMFAINSSMRKVEWRVVPAGDDEENPAPEAQEAADFVESNMNDMCYDDQTEILSKRGWLRFKDLVASDLVAQRSVDGELQYVKPTTRHQFAFDGELMGYRGDAVDFLVTPSHRMLFAQSRGRKHNASQKHNLEIKRCEEIFNKTGWVSKKLAWRGRKCGRDLNWLEFLGFFVADGYASPRQVYLIQKETAYVNALVERVGLTAKMRKRPVNGSMQWIMSDAKFARLLREEFGATARVKKLPQWLKDSTPNELRAFLRGFTEGDGWQSKSGLIGLYTSSDRLADDLQEIAMKAGYVANRSSREQTSGFAIGSMSYRIALWSNRKQFEFPSLKCGRGWYRQPYRGQVYCVSVPSGIVMVRRNGKYLWCGNSHTWEDLVTENLSMLGYGYAPHEIVYKRRLGRSPGNDPDNPGKQLPKSEYDDGLIGWRRIPLRGQDTVLKWFFDATGEIMGMTQLPWIGPMIDLPIEKMLLFRPNQHKNNPEGVSILRTAYIPYYFVKRMQEQEAIVAERMGGVPVLSIPSAVFDAAAAGDTKAMAALETYKKIATNVRIDEQMGIVLPSDPWTGANGTAGTAKQFEFKLETPQGRGIGGFEFDKTINRYNTAMMTSVLADFLSLGHEARGTQSLAVSKVDMFFQAIEGFLNSMAAVYNRHAIPRLWALNGMDYDNMPTIQPDLAQRVDLDVLSNFVLRLSQAGMPMFPNEDLQSYILDAGGLPDVVDDRALQAAGLTDDQLQVTDDKAQAELETAQNPPQPAGAGKTPIEKMLLASIARRMIKMQGPRFGIHTHKHNRHRR